MSKHIVQHRRGTTEQWEAADNSGSPIIPLSGEIVVELDSTNHQHKLKIGDGEHKYGELAYLMAGDEIITQALSRIITVTLPATAWVEAPSVQGVVRYKQTLSLDGITVKSRLDLRPDAAMLAELKNLNLVFVTENHNAEIVVYSVGDKPDNDYTMQATIIESIVDNDENKIVGITVGTPAPQPDWAQDDETKADYIKNKPVWELLIDDTITQDEVDTATNSGNPIKASSYSIQDNKAYDAISVLMYVPQMTEAGNIELTINGKGIGKVVGALPTSNNMVLRIEAEKTYAWKTDFFFTPSSDSYDATSVLTYNIPYSAETKTIASCYRNFVTANAMSLISVVSNKALPAGTVVKMMARRVK